MEPDSQPYRGSGDDFSSQAWCAGSAVAGSGHSTVLLVLRQDWHTPDGKQ